MAGFAVFMAMFTFAVLGMIAATVASLALRFAANRRLKTEAAYQRGLVRELSLAPFAGLLWIALAFVLHVEISNHLAHQDCGLGLSPDPFVRLPNGYTLGSLNTYSGYIVAPGFSTDVPMHGPGYVRSLMTLRLSNDVFSGTYFEQTRVRPFTLNATTRAFTTDGNKVEDGTPCPSTDKHCVDLWGQALTESYQNPDSYWTFYQRSRHAWPPYVFFLLLASGEVAIGWQVTKLWLSLPKSTGAAA